MKTYNILIYLFIGLFLLSCKKEESLNNKGEIKFYVNKAGNSKLKAYLAEPHLSYVLVTIENSLAEKVYDMEKIELFNFSDYYISKSLTLQVGNYKLTQFAVLDSAGKSIYATPVAGSPNADFVSHPLSIDFTITKDAYTYLVPEVISTDGYFPADLGYSTFTFDKIIIRKLIAYYPFNLNARDMSGNGYNGVVYGGIGYGTDRLGNLNSAFVFNGNDNFVILGNNFDIPEKSINLWFKCSAFLTGQLNDINYLYSDDNHNLYYGLNYIYIRRYGSTERLYFAVNVATGNMQNLDSADFNYNQWYNPCITVDKNYIKYYLDGVLLNSYSNNVNYRSNEGIANVILGSNRVCQNQYFDGSIDDIRIYNFALNDQQIDSLYNNLVPVLKK